MGIDEKDAAVSRRDFLRKGAVGVGASALAGLAVQEVDAQRGGQRWDMSADFVTIGAGTAGLAGAVSALEHRATVIMIDENFDIGGHGMVSGGNVHLGGGNSRQKKFGVQDSADQVFNDWVRYDHRESRYSDRDLVRAFADENAAAFEFLIANGVQFTDESTGPGAASTVARQGTAVQWPIKSEIMTADPTRTRLGHRARAREDREGQGREDSPEAQDGQHRARESSSGRVLGITATTDGRTVRIEAKKGVLMATGGHTSNVTFRRMFDPRLTEEYQVAGEPYSRQTGDGELAAMAIGAVLWGTASQTVDAGAWLNKTALHRLPMGLQPACSGPPKARSSTAIKAMGLANVNWQNVILVNQAGRRFCNEVATGYDFFNAALGYSGNSTKLNGGGPIWAIFDADAVERQNWDPKPPYVDPEVLLQRGHHPGTGAGDREPVSDEADAGRGAAGNGDEVQLVRRCRRGCRLQEADAALQDPEAAVLRRVVDAYPSRFALRAPNEREVAGARHAGSGDPRSVLRRRITRRICAAWAGPGNRLWPHCRPGGGPDWRPDLKVIGSLPDGAMTTHRSVVDTSQAVPAEVEAGTDIRLNVRVTCVAGCDMRGAPIAVLAGEETIAGAALSSYNGTENETENLCLKAPGTVGEHVWTVVFRRYEGESVAHEESSRPVVFKTVPHETTMAIWDVPSSPVLVDHPFIVKVGVKCAATCALGGQTVVVVDESGRRMGHGALNETPWPDTVALYVAEVALVAPANAGMASWSARFAETDLALPHAETSPRSRSSPRCRPITSSRSALPTSTRTRRLSRWKSGAGAIAASTNAQGFAALQLPAGTYEVSAWKLGYDDAEPTTIEVKTDLRIQSRDLAHARDESGHRARLDVNETWANCG